MATQSSSKNKLGLWTTTSLVVGNMVGVGIFMLPAALSSFGGISLLGWMLSAIGAIAIATVFSKASRLLPNINGGPYAFTRYAFGDFAGFLVAWGYWISVWTTNATIAVSLVGGLSVFFPGLATNSVSAVITGLSAIWFLTWINTRGVIVSGKLQLFTTILKLIPLISVAVFGLFFIRRENFTPFNISGTTAISAITASATMTLFAFLGIECATIPAGHVERPEKIVPRATMIGTLVSTVVYILATLSVMGMIPPKLLQRSVTPVADAAAIIWGEHARYWVGAGVVLAAFGALNGWILVQGQIPFAIAKDKLFPGIFGRENKKGTPAAAILISSVIASVFMMMNYTKALVQQFKFMLLISTLSALVPYILVAASYVIIAIDRKEMNAKTWKKIIFPASLAFLFSLLAIIGAGMEAVFWGFILLLAGVPFYVWIRWKKDQ
ncbi:MAG TPA: amino acid permease [Puia sp.]|nr:amino acid permease [Puia sp.]